MTDTTTETQPPDDEVANASSTRFARAHLILLGFTALALVVWILSGFYQVKANQVAVIERLGEYERNVDSQIIEYHAGAHYHLPWPIDIVHIISTEERLTLDVDTFNTAPTAYADMKSQLQKEQWDSRVIDALFNPYLITADKSIVNLEVKVTYRINDAGLWLTTISHESDDAGEPNDTRAQIFAQLAQRAMIHRMSSMSFENVMFDQRPMLPQFLLASLRSSFALRDTTDPKGAKTRQLGVELQRVDVTQAGPPDFVAPAFNEVTNARQRRQAVEVAAGTEANSMATAANADAQTMVLEAQAYATRQVETARGEADRFKQVLVQYRNAPDITRWSLYMDAINTVTRSASRIFVAQPGEKVIITIDSPKYDAGQVTTKP